MRVAVIGSGYVGTVTAGCLAWLGHHVAGYDADAVRAQQLAAGQVPFYEPGLAEMIREATAGGRLTFTAEAAPAVEHARVVFLCVGTPPAPDGLPDLSQVQAAASALAAHLADGAIVVNKSTVPVGSGNWVRTLIEDALPRANMPRFAVVSNPEFLREGSAIEDFLHPDRIVLGGENGGREAVAELYRPILEQSFPGGVQGQRPQLFLTDVPSAEMIKYAANAFLATKISFANEMAGICELVGADARQVLPAIGEDVRIGRMFLAPGVGWGGSCFGKDVAALIATGREYGHISSLLNATVEVNQQQRALVTRKLQSRLKVLKGHRIGVLGLSFKPDTDDTRDAPALDICRRLIACGAVVSAYDPIVKELPPDLAAVRIGTDAYDTADRADALVVVTEWPEFLALDPGRLRQVMRGALVVDGRNALDPSRFAAAGIEVSGVGW